MIDAIQFQKLLDGNSLLSQKELTDCIRRYPYFQIARWLGLKNTEARSDEQQAKMLCNAAVFSPDRDELFYYVERENLPWYEMEQKAEALKTEEYEGDEKAFSVIDTFLSIYDKNGKEEKDLAALLEYPVADYIPGLSDEKNCPVEENTETEAQIASFSLVNDFLRKKDDGEIKFIPSDISKSEMDGPPPAITSEEGLGDDFLTESLAKIYISQRRYAKALEIIKKINLKYPEKNIYFADQIRFLEKLIINIKP